MKTFLSLILAIVAALATLAPAVATAEVKHGATRAASPSHSGHRHHHNHHNYGYRGHTALGSFWGPSLTWGLPFGYSRLWFGGVPYYYADNVYYQRVLNEYRVVPAPTGEGVLLPPVSRAPTPSYAQRAPAATDALVITAQRGQSATQQSFDRIDCERAAIRTTGFDPATSTGAALAKAEFVKAVATCLTGVGYSVK